MQRHSLLILAIFYLVIRYGFRNYLRELGPSSTDIFESLCVVAAIFIHGKKFLELLKPVKSVWQGTALATVAGFAIFRYAEYSGLRIPFDLTNPQTVFLVLVFSPVVEEGVFRFLLWQPLKGVSKNPFVPLLVTSALYSYSHFHATFFTPPEIHGFIIYQTFYTFFIGMACGYYLYRHSSLTSAVLIHFGFNLGFCVASFFYA